MCDVNKQVELAQQGIALQKMYVCIFYVCIIIIIFLSLVSCLSAFVYPSPLCLPTSGLPHPHPHPYPHPSGHGIPVPIGTTVDPLFTNPSTFLMSECSPMWRQKCPVLTVFGLPCTDSVFALPCTDSVWFAQY